MLVITRTRRVASMSLAVRNAAAVVRLRCYGVYTEKAVERVLEEAFRSRLKRADSVRRSGIGNLISELRGAISFDIVLAALLERRTHPCLSERRRVAIAAENAQETRSIFPG